MLGGLPGRFWMLMVVRSLCSAMSWRGSGSQWGPIDGLGRWTAQANQGLIAHPHRIVNPRIPGLRSDEDGQHIGAVALPQGVTQVVVAQRKEQFVLPGLANAARGTGEQVAVRILDQDAGGHSRMHTTGVARAWLALLRACRNEVVTNTLGGEQLGVVEISDHAMVGEVFEQDGDPAVGIRPYGKGDGVANETAPDFDRDGFRRLGNCRLTLPPSAILRDLRVSRAHGQHHMPTACPLLWLDDPVDLRRRTVADDKVTVKLDVG